MRDYYQIFKVKLSDSDFNNLKMEICSNPNFQGELDYYKGQPDISNRFDTILYADKCSYIKEYYTQKKHSDGTFHFVVRLSKTDKTLEYIASDE